MWTIAIELGGALYFVLMLGLSSALWVFGWKQSKCLNRRICFRDKALERYKERMNTIHTRARAMELAVQAGVEDPHFTCDECMLRYTCKYAYQDGCNDGKCAAQQNPNEVITV